MPFRYARAAARSGPSVSARLRCLRSIAAGTVATASRGAARRILSPRRRVARTRPGGGRVAHPRALPLGQAPKVALDLTRIDLAAREVHVGGPEQAALVAGQGHPLGEDVVGVRQAGTTVGAGVVRERDAVLRQWPLR